jgi:glycosyltransferase involved in cell wall biosynthesis
MVSVIIPVFNQKEDFLRDAIQSVWTQTYKGRIQLIIVDDGSDIPVSSYIINEKIKLADNLTTIMDSGSLENKEMLKKTRLDSFNLETIEEKMKLSKTNPLVSCSLPKISVGTL